MYGSLSLYTHIYMSWDWDWDHDGVDHDHGSDGLKGFLGKIFFFFLLKKVEFGGRSIVVRGENSRGLNITYSRSTRGVFIFQPTKIIFFTSNLVSSFWPRPSWCVFRCLLKLGDFNFSSFLFPFSVLAGGFMVMVSVMLVFWRKQGFSFFLCFWEMDRAAVTIGPGMDMPIMHDSDRYELVRDIGSGNFGVARLMRDRQTNELVAVKYIERGDKVRLVFLSCFYFFQFWTLLSFFFLLIMSWHRISEVGWLVGSFSLSLLV